MSSLWVAMRQCAYVSILVLLWLLSTARGAVTATTSSSTISAPQYVANEWIMTMHSVSLQDVPSATDIATFGATLLQVSYSPQARMAMLLISGTPMAVASVATSSLMPVTASRIQTTPNAKVSVADDIWPLQRISQRNLPLSGSYVLPGASNAGLGSHVYVVDTGVSMHPDLAGRVQWDYTGSSGAFDDCYGHGTHVAGSVAGTTYGVAKQAIVHSVRALGFDCSGSGTLFNLALALAWIRDNAPVTGQDVINLSLAYGSYDPTIDTLLQQLIAKGFSVFAAAGNSGTNACFNYPSSSVGVNSVGASDVNDAVPSFSNFGPCVTFFAPGASILSSYLSGGTATFSGTSMSTGFASGAGALLLSDFPGTSPALVTAALRSRATTGVLVGIGSTSPNLLLYVNTLTSPTSGSSPSPSPPTPAPAPAPPTPSPPAPTLAPTPPPSSSAQRNTIHALLLLAVILFVL